MTLRAVLTVACLFTAAIAFLWCAPVQPPQPLGSKPPVGPKRPEPSEADRFAATLNSLSERAEDPTLTEDQTDALLAEMEHQLEHYFELPDTVRSAPQVQGALERMCDLSLQLQLDENAEPETPETAEGSPGDDILHVTTFLAADDLKKTYAEVEKALKQTDLGFTIPTNDAVVTYVNLFQTRLRDWFTSALARGAPYVPKMQAVFKDEGIPPALVWMAVVESAFNPTARSRARAVGMWQFIEGTGRRYGLAVDFWEDQRRDPEISARAAARYLKDLYGMFGDWQLALAAYNCGEAVILKYTVRSPEGNFWQLRNTRFLHRETREYVPAIMASILMASNPKAYGIEFVADAAPTPTATYLLEEATDLRVLARCADVPVETLQGLNPSLKRLMTPPRPFELRIPAKSLDGFQAKLEAVPASERVAVATHEVKAGESLTKIAHDYNVPAEAIRLANRLPNKSVHQGEMLVVPLGIAASDPSLYAEERRPSSRGSRVYKVRKGDTLAAVSRRTGVSVEKLRDLNSLSSDELKPGQRLVVSEAAQAPEKPVQRKPAPAAPAQQAQARKDRIHHVHEGDTLWDLAKRYGTTVDRICRANRISPSKRLKVGDTLLIP